MSRKRPGSKRKDSKQALGIAVVSLSLAGGASASTTMPVPHAASNPICDEEVVDVTLATFHFFDEKKPFRIAGRVGYGGVARTDTGPGSSALAPNRVELVQYYGYGSRCRSGSPRAGRK